MSECKKEPMFVCQKSGVKVRLVKINEIKRKLVVNEMSSGLDIVMQFDPGFSALAYFQKWFKELNEIKTT